MAAHLFAEEINTESDLVGENLATKRNELYFQDLPMYYCLQRAFQNPSILVFETLSEKPRRTQFVFGL